MAANDQVKAIFAGARQVHGQALERLEQGDIRDAAEKAWCATKRATDALIPARTGREPRTTGQTGRELGRRNRKTRQSGLCARYTQSGRPTCMAAAFMTALALAKPSPQTSGKL